MPGTCSTPYPKRLQSLLLSLALLAGSFGVGTRGSGGATRSADVALNGEIVDLACYITQGSLGEMHRPCALKCARMGQPVGLLSADGKVYLLVADHVDTAPYEKARGLAGEAVTIRGEVAEKGGLRVVTVHAARKK